MRLALLTTLAAAAIAALAAGAAAPPAKAIPPPGLCGVWLEWPAGPQVTFTFGRGYVRVGKVTVFCTTPVISIHYYSTLWRHVEGQDPEARLMNQGEAFCNSPAGNPTRPACLSSTVYYRADYVCTPTGVTSVRYQQRIVGEIKYQDAAGNLQNISVSELAGTIPPPQNTGFLYTKCL